MFTERFAQFGLSFLTPSNDANDLLVFDKSSFEIKEIGLHFHVMIVVLCKMLNGMLMEYMY